MMDENNNNCHIKHLKAIIIVALSKNYNNR